MYIHIIHDISLIIPYNLRQYLQTIKIAESIPLSLNFPFVTVVTLPRFSFPRLPRVDLDVHGLHCLTGASKGALHPVPLHLADLQAAYATKERG